MKNRAIILGITGNTGSGKSLITKILENLGAYVIDADKLGHNVILRGQPAYNEITSFFGDSILSEAGEIDRKRLGAIVFSDSASLAKLTEITHKYIKEETKNIISSLEKSSNCKCIIIDAPLLFEAGIDKLCDKIILVLSPEKIRIDRIILRDNITLESAKKRALSQRSAYEYRKKADFIIENSNMSISELTEQVTECFMHFISGTWQK